MTLFLIGDYNILPQKELHRSLHVPGALTGNFLDSQGRPVWHVVDRGLDISRVLSQALPEEGEEQRELGLLFRSTAMTPVLGG